MHRDGIMLYASATSIINSLASNKIIVTTPLTNNYTVTVDLVIWFMHMFNVLSTASDHPFK